MTDITVYACGTAVRIKNADVSGWITGINIRQGNSILYQVSYSLNNNITEQWFYDFQFEVCAEPAYAIGFVTDKAKE